MVSLRTIIRVLNQKQLKNRCHEGVKTTIPFFHSLEFSGGKIPKWHKYLQVQGIHGLGENKPSNSHGS